MFAGLKVISPPSTANADVQNVTSILMMRKPVLCICIRLLVTASAVFLVFYIEALLSIVAFTAEVSLGQLAHVHLVRTLRHLEYLIVAAGTLEALVIYVFFMAENDR